MAAAAAVAAFVDGDRTVFRFVRRSTARFHSVAVAGRGEEAQGGGVRVGIVIATPVKSPFFVPYYSCMGSDADISLVPR